MRRFSANLNDVWIVRLQATAVRNPFLSEPCTCLPFRLPPQSFCHAAACDAYKQGSSTMEGLGKPRITISDWVRKKEKEEARRRRTDRLPSYCFIRLSWQGGPTHLSQSAQCCLFCPACLLLGASIFVDKKNQLIFLKAWVNRAIAIQEESVFLKKQTLLQMLHRLLMGKWQRMPPTTRTKADSHGGNSWKETLAHATVATDIVYLSRPSRIQSIQIFFCIGKFLKSDTITAWWVQVHLLVPRKRAVASGCNEDGCCLVKMFHQVCYFLFFKERKKIMMTG